MLNKYSISLTFSSPYVLSPELNTNALPGPRLGEPAMKDEADTQREGGALGVSYLDGALVIEGEAVGKVGATSFHDMIWLACWRVILIEPR
jgi:hypothetical protein